MTHEVETSANAPDRVTDGGQQQGDVQGGPNLEARGTNEIIGAMRETCIPAGGGSGDYSKILSPVELSGAQGGCPSGGPGDGGRSGVDGSMQPHDYPGLRPEAPQPADPRKPGGSPNERDSGANETTRSSKPVVPDDVRNTPSRSRQ